MEKKGMVFAVLAMVGLLIIVPMVSAQELVVREVTVKQVVIEVPLLKAQLAKEGITNPKWEISASFDYKQADGKWILISQASYAAMKTELIGDTIRATFSIPAEAPAVSRLRIWGQDLNSKKWLWVNTSDKFIRHDRQGNPAYEIEIDTKSQRFASVPAQAPVRP